MKNNLVISVVFAVLVGAGAFFGGIQYQKAQTTTGAGTQFADARNGQAGFAGRTGSTQGVRPVAGQILSSDDTSITVELQDGSSKIIILSDKTTINKATTGTKSDLKIGEMISAFGTQNSDGSTTAQTVSIGGGMMMRGTQGGSITATPKQ